MNQQMISKRLSKTQRPTTKLEIDLLNTGYQRIVGIDEVGRGAWAGPVVVGAFAYYPFSKTIPEVRDSKLLSPAKREIINEELRKEEYSLAVADNTMIDTLGVGQAICALISELIDKFDDHNTFFLVDGRFKADFHLSCKKLVKGDLQHYSIASASILAKVFRDNLMQKLDRFFPNFDFASNVGYPTPRHIKALQQFGPSKIHRFSYKPIKQLQHDKHQG